MSGWSTSLTLQLDNTKAKLPTRLIQEGSSVSTPGSIKQYDQSDTSATAATTTTGLARAAPLKMLEI
jgi:hypothetical protein